MVSEIKFDKINTYDTPTNVGTKKSRTSSTETQKTDVAVTNHLNELIKSINTQPEPVNNAIVQDIRQRIQRNDYVIDFDTLSERLLRSGVITMVGE